MGKVKETSTNYKNRKFLTTCNMTYAVQMIGGRWKILILSALEHAPKRYGALKKAIPGLTERMLTLQLREMEEDGLVKRTVFPEVPPRVEYELTESARELLPICNYLHEWGTRHRNVHQFAG
ncbi:winged helix-turn-helix transcriptional regulator [Dinghuibacter silviterrae]|uniref:HxlR family transcriptional regulator n=1 Tax=Dinghuibacter silviterrae TaxID=1539049 RepID=A0A4R8DUU1_9BACT|nr:helix-turn-helix domain-containing protein [Dinghuibacter silviterrae]TDX02154.1 HxlR family transcriptional regulator [Dinghuibacter silviterrae]